MEEPRHPVAGIDYPGTLQEFDKWFNDDDACSEVWTDGWNGYNGIEFMGYKHKVKKIRASEDPAHVVMPRVHRIASLLDRWWLGIHQGAIRPSHLEYYLDEFTFRFNRRTSRARGLLFYRLMEQAIDCAPIPRRMLVGGRPQHIVGG